MKKYDVVVLGAGPGGYVSAIRAAQLGAKTAIIEKKKVGGTCLNVGCIPTKALIKNVEILHAIDIGRKRGILTGEISLDFKKAISEKDKAVTQLTNGVSGLLLSNGIDVYQGVGIVKEPGIIGVKQESEETVIIEYKKLIIATGSMPAKPLIKGIDNCGVITSDELLSIDEVPENLIIVGGGVIGCEMASIFKAYGSNVTIVEMMSSLVDILDNDISQNMMSIIKGQGIDVKVNRSVKEIFETDSGILSMAIEDRDGNIEIITGNNVLISTGRRPVTEGLEILNLDTEKGFIKVNDKLETNVENVYAIGDATGKKQLAHVASEMGVCAAENAMGADKRMELDVVPSCIYTIPEVGSVGISEKEAKEKGYEIVVGKFPLIACGKAIATGEPDGMFKVIADKNTREILGAHLVGKSATELIAEVSAYMHMGATVDDITETIHAHPTISEAISEAARDVDSCCIHMPKI